MGINLSFLPFFDACREQGVFESRAMLVLGAQTLHDSEADIKEFAMGQGYKRLYEKPDLRVLFEERYGVSDYTDCDINDDADLKLDLSKGIASEMRGKFSCILDAGTFEHIFNIGIAFENMHKMLAKGAFLLHISPVSWLNHAFYNLNPSLFEAVSAANNYEKIAEAYHFPGKESFWKKKNTPEIFVTFNGKLGQTAMETARKRLMADGIAAHCLYMCAHRKTTDAAFNVPYDIMN